HGDPTRWMLWDGGQLRHGEGALRGVGRRGRATAATRAAGAARRGPPRRRVLVPDPGAGPREPTGGAPRPAAGPGGRRTATRVGGREVTAPAHPVGALLVPYLSM